MQFTALYLLNTVQTYKMPVPNFFGTVPNENIYYKHFSNQQKKQLTIDN